MAGVAGNIDRTQEVAIDGVASEFGFVVELRTEPRQFGGGHLDNAGAAELLSQARNRYFAEAVAWPGIGRDTVWTSVRRLVIEYESEAFTGERLAAGVRCIGRTRRTVRLREAMWAADAGRVVARCEAVIVTFDVSSRTSIDVPAELWEHVQRFEGPLPTLESGVGAGTALG